jgi:nucleoid-associated protein YgaU
MSKDPALDALKHLFGQDKDKKDEQPQPQPAQAQEQPVDNAAQQASASDQTQQATSSDQTAQSPSYTPPQETPVAQEPAATQQPQYTAPEPVAAAAPSTGGDVEQINGHAVGFAFLRYYREHPEIGLPVDEQHGDVGGWQMFENAILHWDGSNVQLEWRAGHEPQKMEAATQSQGQTYTVESGDSLWAIAQKFYGDGSQWQRIYNANRDKISNPDLIHPGEQLQIPQ